jgi:hypothetical protein
LALVRNRGEKVYPPDFFKGKDQFSPRANERNWFVERVTLDAPPAVDRNSDVLTK